jgi:hypothetical protein
MKYALSSRVLHWLMAVIILFGLIFKKGSDPCFDIFRMSSSNDQLICAKEKCDPIQNELNPTWPPFTISFQRLCNREPDRRIEIQF